MQGLVDHDNLYVGLRINHTKEAIRWFGMIYVLEMPKGTQTSGNIHISSTFFPSLSLLR